MTEKSSLEKLKKNYKQIQDKHNLPSFERLNEDFQIEKISECETDILIREVRKYITERFSNYLRFVEATLHPINAPMFVFSFLKGLQLDEKKKLSEIYKKLAKNEIKAIEIDMYFSEEKEAEFILESYKLWQEIKKDLIEIINVVRTNWDNEFEANKGEYFG